MLPSMLLCSASATAFTPRSPLFAPVVVPRAPAIAIHMQMFKKKSRFGDDGTRETGADLMTGVDNSLSKGERRSPRLIAIRFGCDLLSAGLAPWWLPDDPDDYQTVLLGRALLALFSDS